MSARRTKWLLRGIILIATVVLLAAASYVALPRLLPSAMIYAPNAEKTIDPAQDDRHVPDGAEPAWRHLRVAVGPPPASISCLTAAPAKRSPTKARGTVLVLHGIRDSKRSQLSMGAHLCSLGYRAVLVDHRGHGRSTGRFLTYGVHESRDMVQLIDHLEGQGLLPKPVGAIGYSYGGAVALQLAARDERVKAVATVATFSSLRRVVPAYVSHYVPLIGSLLSEAQIEGAVAEAGKQAGFDPARADNTAAAARTAARLLIIHGDQDPKVPVDHARQIHAMASSRAALMIVPGEDHDSILADRTGRVRDKITRWLARWLVARDHDP